MRLLFITALATLPICSLFAGRPVEEEKSVKTVAPVERSRWSFSVAANFRQIDAGFRLRRPAPGLFKGGDRVRYDDGAVGPDGFEKNGFPFIDDGTALGTVNRRSQLSPTTRSDGPGFTLSELRFHAADVKDHASDEETGAGASAEIRYAILQSAKLDVNVLLGYSWVATELGSGPRRLDGFTQGYAYDHSSFSGILLPEARFPFEDEFSNTVYDPKKYNDNGFFVADAREPRKVRDGSGGVVARGYAKLDVDLHEVVLAPELQWNVTDRLHAGLSAGPTLNVVETKLRAGVASYGKGQGRAAREVKLTDDGTDVRLGVAVQVALTLDLTSRLFIEAATSYRYVPSFDVGSDFAHATVDVSSWEGKVGFGFRL